MAETETRYFLGIGELVQVTRLNFDCVICHRQAMFSITRKNEGLPPKYVQFGQRNYYVCMDHMPVDAKVFWKRENQLG